MEIFGSNTIDVQPRGSVEMDLGVRYTKQDNPSFSPRNRTTTTFDFDQRINMSLTGKVGTRLNVNANYDTESTFAFQNLFKLAYTPSEDDIVQKVEVEEENNKAMESFNEIRIDWGRKDELLFQRLFCWRYLFVRQDVL